jgi:hypothetical protein
MTGTLRILCQLLKKLSHCYNCLLFEVRYTGDICMIVISILKMQIEKIFYYEKNQENAEFNLLEAK